MAEYEIGTPGFGREGHYDDRFILNNHEGVSRGEYAVVTAAIPEKTLLKLNAGGDALEPVTAVTDTVFGILVADKLAGQLVANVWTKGRFNKAQVLPAGLDFNQLNMANTDLYLQPLIYGGAE